MNIGLIYRQTDLIIIESLYDSGDGHVYRVVIETGSCSDDSITKFNAVSYAVKVF